MNLPPEIVIEDDPGRPERRLALWRDAVGDHMADVDLSAAGDTPAEMRLRGSLRLRSFDAAMIAAIAAGGQRLERTPERVRRSVSDRVFVTAALSGECRLAQGGGREIVHAGALCVYAAAEPYEIETSLDFSSVLVGVERAALDRRLGGLDGVTGARAEGAAARVAGRYWAHLSREIGAMDRACAEEMLEAGLDLLAAALRPLRAAPPSRAEAALRRARVAIAQGHADPHFSPRDVARAAGLSVRRLQEVFHEAGDAPAAAIRRARLETARRLLADRRFAALPIKTLMAEAGFRHPAPFARAFAAAFGLGPAEARRRNGVSKAG